MGKIIVFLGGFFVIHVKKIKNTLVGQMLVSSWLIKPEGLKRKVWL